MRLTVAHLVTEGLATFVLLKAWAEWMEASGRYAETTQRQYRRSMIAFLAEGLVPLEEVCEDDVIEYLRGSAARGKGRSETIRALKSFYRWAVRRGHVERSPVDDIDVPIAKLGDAPYLNADELEAVLGAAEQLDPRARPALELMAATGARVASFCAVTADDIDHSKREIRFWVAKGSKPYTNPLSDRAYAAACRLIELASYVPPHAESRRPTLVGVAPPVVQRWCKLAGEMVGIRCYPHLLRHTFAERIANNPDLISC